MLQQIQEDNLIVNRVDSPLLGEAIPQNSVYREGKITVLEGKQRSGKTLGMAILALDEYLTNHSLILTNVAYESPVTHKIRIPFRPLNFFELTMEKIDQFVNSVITIDELNFWLDCRGSMTKINRKFAQWLLQSKKMGINTYGTTHMLSYLDLRFQDNYDYLINPTCYFNKASDTPDVPIALRLKWYNGPNQRHFRKTITIDFRKKPQLLNLYNTRHTFNPFAEMEEHMKQEKAEARKNGGRGRILAKDGMPVYSGKTPLQKLIPDWKPPTNLSGFGFPEANGVVS